MSASTKAVCWQHRLVELGACADAREWAAPYATFAEAWAACERGDWMLWLIGRASAAPQDSVARQQLVLAACACARLALSHVTAGEQRPLRAIETAERWANGEEGVTLSDVRAAANAANAAYAAIAAAAHAAAAAAVAAAAAHAANAAIAAIAAAAAAAYAASSQAHAAATLKQCADIVRVRYRAEEVLS